MVGFFGGHLTPRCQLVAITTACAAGGSWLLLGLRSPACNWPTAHRKWKLVLCEAPKLPAAVCCPARRQPQPTIKKKKPGHVSSGAKGPNHDQEESRLATGNAVRSCSAGSFIFLLGSPGTGSVMQCHSSTYIQPSMSTIWKIRVSCKYSSSAT